MLEHTQIIEEKEEKEMPSLNHSYICAQLMRQLLQNENIQPLPELTLDIGNGLTPDISIFPKEKIRPDFFEDILKIKELPILVIEIVSPIQTIHAVMEKSKQMVNSGVNTAWTVEPCSRSIFVIDKQGKKLYHEESVESEGITVDFSEVFSKEYS
jgi:Uma2 family endonuclease